jgi:uncharacterized protein with ParB-like and HNH nuclease domain
MVSTSDLIADQANEQENEWDEVIPFEYAITSYGADYPVDGLVKRINNNDIYVPSFQRGYVWKIKDASRLIESLLLGLPVPGIFFAREPETQKLLVIDGQQRLKTIQYFYNGVFEPSKKEFALEKVNSRFVGLTYKTLSEEDRRRLDDSIIPATIVKQDEPSSDLSSIYHIFERLNTGGTNLQAQEIRACIYHGEFQELLKKLNNNLIWRSIYSQEPDKRMRDQEMILRFFALHFDKKEYKKPMKKFLNNFMGKNRHCQIYSQDILSQIFCKTVEVVEKSLGDYAFKPKRDFNASTFDAIMVGISTRLANHEIEDYESVRIAYDDLLNNQKFQDVTVNTGRTTDKNEVDTRLSMAIKAFENIK